MKTRIIVAALVACVLSASPSFAIEFSGGILGKLQEHCRGKSCHSAPAPACEPAPEPEPECVPCEAAPEPAPAPECVACEPAPEAAPAPAPCQVCEVAAEPVAAEPQETIISETIISEVRLPEVEVGTPTTVAPAIEAAPIEIAPAVSDGAEYNERVLRDEIVSGIRVVFSKLQ